MTSIELTLLQAEAPTAVFKRIPVHLFAEVKNKYEDQWEDFNKKGEIDVPPDLPYWKEIESKFDTKVSQLALIDSNLCWVDRSYDRVVNWTNLIKFIADKNGFSHSDAQIIDVVYDRRKQRFYVVIGQHRVDMSLLCLGINAKIAARITLLDENLTEEEQIKLESNRHHTEANNTTDQKPQEKLLSGYTSGDEDAVDYTTFITAHNVGVIGQEHLFPNNSFVKTCKAPWAVGRAMKISKDDCSFALELIRDYMDCKDIDGKLIQSVTQYLFYFKDRLEKVALVMGVDYKTFVRNFFEHTFSQDPDKGVLMHPTDDLLEGTKDFRGESTVVPVCRLIKLTNQYIRMKKVDLSSIHGNKKDSSNKWVSADEKIFQVYLEKCKVGLVLAQIPRQIINSL